MQKIVNLLPGEERKQLVFERYNYQLTKFGAWLISSLLVMMAIIFVSQLFLSKKLSSTNDQVVAKKQELVAVQEKGIQKQVDDLNQTIQNFKSIETQDVKWSPYLIAFAQLLPSDVSVSTMVFTRSSQKVEVTGHAKTRESVLLLRQNILNSGYFTNVNFPLYNLQSPQDLNWKYRFYLKKPLSTANN